MAMHASSCGYLQQLDIKISWTEYYAPCLGEPCVTVCMDGGANGTEAGSQIREIPELTDMLVRASDRCVCGAVKQSVICGHRECSSDVSRRQLWVRQDGTIDDRSRVWVEHSIGNMWNMQSETGARCWVHRPEGAAMATGSRRELSRGNTPRGNTRTHSKTRRRSHAYLDPITECGVAS